MKLIPVESLPRRRSQHHLQDLVEEFVRSDADVVKVDIDEHDYKSAKVCRSCLGIAAKKSGHLIKAALRDGEVFLHKI